MHKRIALKTILKFTLKQLRHVSVQSNHHEGAHYCICICSHITTELTTPMYF